MKLIDLIVKEVKRENIPSGVNFVTQDWNTIDYDISFWTKFPKRSVSFWDSGNELYHFSPSNKSDDAQDVVINIKDLISAYDTAEKLAEPENLIDDDSFGQSERYNRGNIECIDIIREMVSDKSGEEAFCVGNITKYLYRYKSKGGLKDVIKARNYLNQMIKGMENE